MGNDSDVKLNGEEGVDYMSIDCATFQCDCNERRKKRSVNIFKLLLESNLWIQTKIILSIMRN